MSRKHTENPPDAWAGRGGAEQRTSWAAAAIALLVVVGIASPAAAVGQAAAQPPQASAGAEDVHVESAGSLLILRLTPSARATALGGAYWTAGGADHAVFHHPALLSGSGFDLSALRSAPGSPGPAAEHLRSSGGEATGTDHADGDAGFGLRARHLVLSGSGSWLGGAVAAGMAVLDYEPSADGPVDPVDPEHGDGAAGDAAAREARHEDGATEYVAAAGLANEAFGVDWGLAAKVAGRRGKGDAETFALMDAGVARRFGRVLAALSVQNLELGGGRNGEDAALPRRFTIAAGAGRRPVGPLDIGAAARVTVERGGEVVPGGGVEVAWWPLVRRVFVARIGAARVVEGDGLPLTFGLGFEGDSFRLDYSYAEADPLQGAHRVGFSLR